MTRSILLTALILITGLSCNKKSNENPVDPFFCKYFPLSEGSSWTYNGKLAGMNKTITNIASEVSTSGSSVTATYTRGAGVPEQVVCANGELTGTTSSAITGTVTATVLREMAAKDSVWVNDYIIQSFPTRVELIVKDKGGSRMVNGTIYNDIIHMNENLYIDLGGGFTLIQSSNTYYAPFVGVIERFTDSLNYDRLLNYNIVQ